MAQQKNAKTAALIAAGLLLAALFMAWYAHLDSFGPDYSLSGWQALGWEDVVIAFAALTAAGSVVAAWTAGEGSSEFVIGAGVVAVAICVWRITSPPEIADSTSGGAYVAAVAAIGLIASGLAWRTSE